MIVFQAAPAEVPDGGRVYAIGDIHGCFDRLTALHAAIADDLNTRPCESAVLVHLGDYVDRGPASALVVGCLAAGNPIPDLSTVNLSVRSKSP